MRNAYKINFIFSKKKKGVIYTTNKKRYLWRPKSKLAKELDSLGDHCVSDNQCSCTRDRKGQKEVSVRAAGIQSKAGWLV